MPLYSTRRIVLGHHDSTIGLEADRAKIDIMVKLPPYKNEFKVSWEMLGSTGGSLKTFQR